MKTLRHLIIASAILAALPAHAQIAAFKHIVVIVQENRTPDNLFHELCNYAACSTSDKTKYDILTDGWKTINNGTVTPAAVDLQIGWDIHHLHLWDWLPMCDLNQAQNACQMDGAVKEDCYVLSGPNGCTTNSSQPEFTYVQRYNYNYAPALDVLGPYMTLALNYGWANKMFQTNQGPSFPAHQFIYGATAAPVVNNNENDDNDGVYVAENGKGCLDAPGTEVNTIVHGVENQITTTFPCFTHLTLGTGLFGSPKPWRYYTPKEEGLWDAPEAILSECGVSNQESSPDGPYTACTGSEFGDNVVVGPAQVLVDVQNCHLQSLSWVIPMGQYSDHAGIDTDFGPQWVANVVNAIGGSQCQDSGKTYWQDTAIIIVWDDWGGWYDHEPPPLNQTQGYQLGFRVPLLVVSGYGANNTGSSPRTCLPYIDGDDVLDFGSIDNFIEGNFLGGWTQSNEGKLGFADLRAYQRGVNFGMYEDLTNFFDLTQQACTFVPVPTQEGYDATYFIKDRSPVLDPDDE